ncbi:hypothetical protein V3Q90_00555 [Flavobacterium oreochromis]|uniref:hypothetical protein n=1 Tax=Flavobacterium oreochromis TaxID=2906078 RepID=UPI0038587388
MKILIVAFLFASTLNAQVSTIVSGFTQNLTKNDLPFQGDRKMYAIGLNDKLTENFLVVSKNKSGAATDELYIEKFTKTNQGYEKTFATNFSHPINKSLAFVNNRMKYTDVDKDGNMEMLLVIDENQAGPESPLHKVWGLIIYKNEAYKLWTTADSDFTKTNFDEKMAKLPENIKTNLVAFWDELDKK